MLKCDILNKDKNNRIKFDDLKVGETFLIKNSDYDIEWYGMKVCYSCGDEPVYYIMDISDEIGKLYSDNDMYNIVKLVELKVVEDED